MLGFRNKVIPEKWVKQNVMVVQPRGSRLSESKYSVGVKWDFEIDKRDRQSATKE